MKDAHGRRRPAPQFPPHHEDVSVGGVGPATPMKVGTTNEPSPSPEAAQKPKAKVAVVVPMVSPLESVERAPTPPVKTPPTPSPTAPSVVSPPATKKAAVPLSVSGPQLVAAGEAQKLPTRKGGGCTVGSLTGQSQRRNTSLDTVLNYRSNEDSPSSATTSNARSSPSPAWPKTLPSGKNNNKTAATNTHHHHPTHINPLTSGNHTSTSSIHVLVDPSNMEGTPAQGLPRLQRSSMVPARTVPVVEPSMVHQPSQPSREFSEKRRAPSSSSAHRGDPQEGVDEGVDTSQLPAFSQIELDGEEESDAESSEGTILRESF